MNKIKKTIKDSKNLFIIIGVLWFILTIVLVAPIAYSIGEATINEQLDITTFIDTFIPALTSLSSIVEVIKAGYFGVFLKTWFWFTIFTIVFTLIGIFKSKDRGGYKDIEHGSSDWCEGGEQYKVLSKNSGLILAEKNYLPLDKMGNINVLIVGRIWCW